MRLRITGSTPALRRNILRHAMWFFADEILTDAQNKKVKIHLRFSKTFPRDTGAEMWRNRTNNFTIKCSSKNGPYRTLQDLAHELVHVAQFMSGKMTEKAGGTSWQGRLYRGDFMKANEDYWNAPWEIDANGRSYWLYKKCRLHLNQCGYRLRKCSKQ